MVITMGYILGYLIGYVVAGHIWFGATSFFSVFLALQKVQELYKKYAA